jgi:hypothetical protein
MKIDMNCIDGYYAELDESSRLSLDESIRKIVEAKRAGGKVVVVTGSGPNLHEGVTTLIAELMRKGVIDGVTTSSAVIAHEMGGVLDKVKRVDGAKLKGLVDEAYLPRGNVFELTQMTSEQWNRVSAEMLIDSELVERCKEADGEVIIKAAGNMAYPMGLRCETLAGEILDIARAYGIPFEEVAGWGADPRTMIGAGAETGLPVLVSIPQLVGGGAVGMAIGDSIPVSQRSARVADLLGSASVIIESAVALTQEIHDGPFETFTGHGIWAMWNGYKTYSIEGKTLIRFDLDENLRKAWEMDKRSGSVQEAINQGLPKTKLTKIPFRMEMSAFCRLEESIPVIGDIGLIWPVMAAKVCAELNIELEFMSHPQQTAEGKAMREMLVSDIDAIDKNKIIKRARNVRNISAVRGK